MIELFQKTLMLIIHQDHVFFLPWTIFFDDTGKVRAIKIINNQLLR